MCACVTVVLHFMLQSQEQAAERARTVSIKDSFTCKVKKHIGLYLGWWFTRCHRAVEINCYCGVKDGTNVEFQSDRISKKC